MWAKSLLDDFLVIRNLIDIMEIDVLTLLKNILKFHCTCGLCIIEFLVDYLLHHIIAIIDS